MIKQVLEAAVLGAVLLSGCELTGWQEPKAPQPYEAVGVTASLAEEAQALIEARYLANSGTLSFYLGDEPTAAGIARRVGAALALQGYAVQTVLPPEQRQHGDAQAHEQMKPAGVPLSMTIIPLTDSDYIEFQVTAGPVRYSKVFAVSAGQARAVSVWNTLTAEQNFLDTEEL